MVATRTEEEILTMAGRAVDLYEAQSPRPVHLTIKQAATMLNVSSPTVSKMLKSGQLRFNRCGRIPIEQIDLAIALSRKKYE
ncbi:DNA-binding protein [Paraburkholderia graminis]|nr:DNA-binding protein [Paraburkholderia graminis]